MGSYSRAKYVTQSTDFPRSADSKSVSASYATFADLPASSTTIGNTAFVVATNKLYIWSGVGWYLVAEVTNASPSAISGVDGTYALATDGTATTITAVSTDPEGFALTWSYAVTSGSLAITPAASAIAVVNNGSGAYTLSGGATGDNSNVDIVVGQTVNFTVNASGHPFYIRDSNGGANVSSPAATGQGATSGVVSWTPNTAGTYYYQCGNHAAMIGTITVGAATVSATVAQADNVFTITPSTNTAAANTFSLTFNVTDGLNGSVSAVSGFTLAFSIANSRYTVLSVNANATGSNQTFDDASASNLTISTAGNASASTFSPHRQGGFSAYFDGNGDYLDTGTNIHDGIGTGDFTVECWFYLENYSGYRGIFGSGSTDANDEFTLMVLMNGLLYFDWGATGSSDYVQASSATPLNIWNHISITRSGTSLNVWLNGTSVASKTTSADIGGSSSFKVGWARQQLFQGYIRDVRVVIGTAVYTSAFTPPTEPLTAITNTAFLLSDLPYFKDQSTSNHTITANGNTLQKPVTLFDNGAVYSKEDHGASAYFDGTGDYISAEDDASFSFGTGDFTVESWLYHQNASASYYDLIGTASNSGYIGSNRGGWIFAYYHTHGSTYALKFGYQYNNAFPVDISFSKTLNVDTWYHIAMTRQGNQLKCFVNGIQVGSTVTNSTNIISTEPLTIGTGSNISTYVTGYMSDVRVVKGTAVYTSNFTPPTAPLTAITNTKFLLNPEPSISDLSQIGNIKLFGNAATSTTQVKFAGTKSIHFANSGDYLQITNSESWISGYAGNYTIEFWWYPTNIALGTYQEPLTCGMGFQLYTQSNGQVALAIDEANAGTFFWHPQNIYQLVDNTWTHFAIVKNGTAYTIYIDGVSKATTTSSNTIGTSAAIELGSYLGGQYPSPGYYQDFRITKGLARYTANFTPPTELQG